MYRWLVRHGYYQKIKYLLLSPLYNGYISCVDKREVPLRKPTRIVGTKNTNGTNGNTQSQGRRQQDVDSRPAVPSDHDVTSTEYGSVTRLLSPDLASSLVTTETLHISWICIRPHCELPSQTSPPFVEFYYVLSGSGRVSQQGMIETMTITTGDAFVVDPCSMRWISCLTTSRRGSSEDEDDDSIHDHDNQSDNDSLILLRVTDGGSLYSKAEWNHIRLDPVHAERLVRQQSSSSRSRRSLTTKSGWQQLVSQGMHRVQQWAAEYAAEYTTTGSSSTSTTSRKDGKDTANPRTH